MTDVQIEAGTLLANAETRIVSGRLLPYGEVGNTNLGKFEVPKGTVTLPRDPSIVSANLDHDREQPIARAQSLTDTDEGVDVEWLVADTDEGDELLAELADKTNPKARTKLSVEVKNVVIRAGKLVSGSLFGGAFVTKGAFPSASLLAADVGELEEVDPNSPVTAVQEVAADGSLDIETSTTPDVVNVHPADSDTPVEFIPKEGADVPVATVPSTLTAAATTAPATTILDVAHALALYAGSSDRSGINKIMKEQEDYQNSSLYAALSDVKTGVTGAAMIQPQWVGELWRGRSFERRIIPLLSKTPLTSNKITGFKWLVEPTMATWAGDKANVPSNAPTTQAYELTALKYAGGHGIAREFYDFPNPEFWAAYFAAMTDSYAKLTDDAALTALVAGATAVTAGTVPTGVSSGLVSIVDGALAVLPTGAPSFAVVAPDVFRSIALTKENDKLAFLNTSLGLEEGTITSFRVVPHSGIAAGKALVGVSAAATFYELPGAAPIRTEALDQVRGGIDEALFGYAVTGVNRPAGLALVTAAA